MAPDARFPDPGSFSILCVLSFSMKLLEAGKTATQREIYYAFVKHFPNQVTATQVTHMARTGTTPSC